MSKVINDLLGYDMKIVQDTEEFNFSLDSVLLAHFVTIKKGTKKILDIGTGTAPIPLFLSKKTNAKIYAIDIQKKSCVMAQESVKLNNLEKQIEIINEDANKLKSCFSAGYFDVIVSNPPYFKVDNNTRLNDNLHKSIARHEIHLTLSQLIEISSFLLDNKGIFALVHRTERLEEIFRELSKNKLIVKKVKFIYSKNDSNSNMVLIESIKNGRPGLKILPPTIIHNSDGSYKEDIKRIFDGGIYESEEL